VDVEFEVGRPRRLYWLAMVDGRAVAPVGVSREQMSYITWVPYCGTDRQFEGVPVYAVVQ
jgi:hypothetical protein